MQMDKGQRSRSRPSAAATHALTRCQIISNVDRALLACKPLSSVKAMKLTCRRHTVQRSGCGGLRSGRRVHMAVCKGSVRAVPVWSAGALCEE